MRGVRRGAGRGGAGREVAERRPTLGQTELSGFLPKAGQGARVAPGPGGGERDGQISRGEDAKNGLSEDGV